MKLTVNESNSSSAAVIYLYENLKDSLKDLALEKGDNLCLQVDDNTKLHTPQTISRFLADKAQKFHAESSIDVAQVNSWLDFANTSLSSDHAFKSSVEYLDRSLGAKDYLVGDHLTIADFAVFAALKAKYVENGHANVSRYLSKLSSTKYFQFNVSSGKAEAKDYSKEGKFIDLPGAEKGKVVVRFPPEASGFLHVGHAKAALLNQYYQKEFEGKMIFRFDDTNPAKENHEFEKVILEDVKLLGCEYDAFTRTSDHFDKLLKYCEEMIRSGKAYADDTEPEEMKRERDLQVDSKNRNNSVAKNLEMWNNMILGNEAGQKCCIRAKIDMKSPNGTMRDPTLYRCKPESHVVTGDKYKVYPTYDFACPIVDSIEGVTHALRTTEYHDRDEQYFWIIDALGLRKPYIYEYSRFNLQNTVLSKRKLTWFVDNKRVNGWDDPRFPTVRGILRRGMTVDALKQFIIAQGSSRSVVQMEWDKIWTINKAFIDAKAPRHNAVLKNQQVVVNVLDTVEESRQLPKHPKNEEVGTKTVWYGPKLLIDAADADTLKEGELVTFMDWGNLEIVKINRDENKIDAKLRLDNKDFKKTTKITWLAQTPNAELTPLACYHYDHIIAKAVLDKEEDFKEYCTHQTEFRFDAVGDSEMKNIKKGDIIQIQRRGYYICDEPYQPAQGSTPARPCVLFNIPEGTKKESPTSYMSMTNQVYHTTTQVVDPNSTSNKKQQKKVVVNDNKENNKPATITYAAVVVQNNTNTTANNSAEQLSEKIKLAGDAVRDLKANKAAKDVVDKEVKNLLELKAEYKKLTGQDWKPAAIAATPAQAPASQSVPVVKSAEPVVAAPNTADQLSQKIKTVGDSIRDLKANKAAKDVIDKEVKNLLELKSEYKKLTGQDWKPDAAVPTSAPVSQNVSTVTSNSSDELSQKIKTVGDSVRDLKANKAAKDVVDKEVKNLLELKAEYKKFTGQDWKPAPTTAPVATSGSQNVTAVKSEPVVALSAADELSEKIKAVGDSVRDLKANKAAKDVIDKEVKNLLELKAEYKKLTGQDWKPVATAVASASTPSTPVVKAEPVASSNTPVAQQKSNKTVEKAEKKQQAKPIAEDASQKKATRLCLEAKKEEDLSDWYSQLITKSELIEYYDVSGCYILRPWAYFIWEKIKEKFDSEIRKLGVQNCYFPLFVSKAALEREKDHINDFAPEVAWVTKSGQTDLAEPIAIRPTSETVMYPAYAKWIQSYRDLPLRLNQWNNVVRWEFKHPQPFLRTREFLWQEGHTAFATYEEASDEVYKILDLYADVYKNLLAVPVIKGRKTEKEKFAGADWTTTIEAYISASGRGIQAATSHHLGQNFSKMFDISFEDPETKVKKNVYQNSWGLTTRTIGILTMVHGDNTGLVLPPSVACYQVVIVPCGITASLSKEDEKKLIEKCKWYEKVLNEADVRVHGDYRDNYSPGWKFNHWELKGVPVRLEVGPKDMAKQKFVAVRRDTGDKLILDEANVVSEIQKLFVDIHNNLYTRAEKDLKSRTAVEDTWIGFLKSLDSNKIIMSPFCGDKQCEDKVKKDSARDAVVEEGAPAMGAKSLCIPFEQPREITSQKCVHPECGNKAQYYTLFGRSY